MACIGLGARSATAAIPDGSLSINGARGKGTIRSRTCAEGALAWQSPSGRIVGRGLAPAVAPEGRHTFPRRGKVPSDSEADEGVPHRTAGHSPSHGLPFGLVRASPLHEGARAAGNGSFPGFSEENKSDIASCGR